MTSSHNQISITECPRDAMQGMSFIPTAKKIGYLRKLMRVGFRRLDCGSFVSARVVPQMRDSRTVMESLANDASIRESPTQLICIVGNEMGAKVGGTCAAVDYLGFPLSVSEQFQQRNLRQSLSASFACLMRVRDIAHSHRQRIIVYLSMAFGNPYGEPHDEQIVMDLLEKLRHRGLTDIALADTVGMANSEQIGKLCKTIYTHFPTLSVGLHLHTTPQEAQQKIAAAHQAGCRHFDAVIKGYGGCPMAQDELVGNLPTEALIAYLRSRSLPVPLCEEAWQQAMACAEQLFAHR